VRHTSFNPSYTFDGGGALDSDSIARLFRRKLRASMNDTSHA
jgi:hypothetical protein